jgi:ubiquinone/menaquinone biosynthesis C-methylase UbiE
MTEAFASIADAYDLLLDQQRLDRELPGLLRLLGPAERICDLGCGCGEHSAALQAAGRTVCGVDCEEAMVEHARRRHPETAFRLGDLCDPPAGPWDGLICLGNVLACLPPRQLAAIAASWARVLAPGGRAIVQIVNPLRSGEVSTVVRQDTDRLLVKSLVPIDDGALLSLLYHVRDGSLWTSQASHQRLHRHQPTAIETAFRAAGFTRLTRFGGLDGRPFDQAASDLVLLADKEHP